MKIKLNIHIALHRPFQSVCNNAKYLNQKDYLKTKIDKKSVFELAKNLCIRLFVIDEENLSDLCK